MRREFEDSAAQLLWDAWNDSYSLEPRELPEFGLARAQAISASLTGPLPQSWHAFWKLGAITAADQKRLGLSGPMVTPLRPERVYIDTAEVELDLGDYVEPRFEPEIAVIIRSGVHTVIPCVEIADSRIAGWEAPPNWAVADLGFQGGAVFGVIPQKTQLDDTNVDIEVRADGHRQASCRVDIEDELKRVGMLPRIDAAVIRVTLGSPIPPISARSGVWQFDFGPLGSIVLHAVGQGRG